MLKNVNDQKSGIIDNINQEISNNNIENKPINEQPVKNNKSKSKNIEILQVKNDVLEVPIELEKSIDKGSDKKTKTPTKTSTKEPVVQEGGQKVNKIKNKTSKTNKDNTNNDNETTDNKTTKKIKSTNDKSKKVKKDKIDDSLENENEDDILVNGKHIRSFKVKLPDSDKYEGRFTGLTPYQAANKALSKFFRESDKPNAEITFSICESTRKSKKSTYTYVGRRLQLEIPVKYKIQDGREIIKNFKNSLKKVKKSELINININ